MSCTRELYQAEDSFDGQKSLFLVVGESMFVSSVVTDQVEEDPWFDKSCELAGYQSEQTDRSRMINAERIW